MPASRPPEDRRPDDIVPVPDEWVDQSAYARPFEEPAGTANVFLQALENPIEYANALHKLTTPESWPAWGDFTAAAAMIRDLGDGWGIGTKGDRPMPDVAYIGIFRDLIKDSAVHVLAETPVLCAAVISLVHRPDRGGWVVHAVGGEYVRPDQLPRDPT